MPASDCAQPLMSSDEEETTLVLESEKAELEQLEDSEAFLASRQQLHREDHDAIAEELSKLSLKEREKVLYDLHGVSDLIEETPELIERALQEISNILDAEGTNKSMGYKAAEAKDASYVQNPKLRLMFLRSESFQAAPAAAKLQSFLTQKLKLFGTDALCRSLTLNDLDEDDMESLRNGHFQFLPNRDRSGRAVLVLASDYISYQRLENEMKQTFYFVMAVLEEEETQKNGIVYIAYKVPAQSPVSTWRMTSATSCLPILIRGFHVVKPIWGSWFNWMLSILESGTRMRLRNHTGSHSDILFSLMTFGIPTSEFPLTEDANGNSLLLRKNHHQWIETRRAIEEARKGCNQTEAKDIPTIFPEDANDEPGILPKCLPGTHDVLFGRGRPYQDHPGNIRLSLILESLQPRYEKLSRNEKTLFAEDIVNKLKAGGVRFLRQEKGCWDDVDDFSAREKVSQGFRSLRAGKVSMGHERAKNVRHIIPKRDLQNPAKRSREAPL